MSEIVLEKVTKKFGQNTAIKDVSLKIDAKELFVLLGPSGSGKTTLLRLVAGLEQPTSGTVCIGGKDVTALSPKLRNIAMVFQNYALYPHMTVLDNISLPLKARHVSVPRIKEKVAEVSNTLHISHLLSKKPREISGGEQQRVALARALVRDPTVFLLDEPLSNLDAKLRLEARSFLKRLQAELGITTIFVTHDQSEAMTLASMIAVLNKGEVVQAAEPYELYSKPGDTFTAGFVGSPAMNLVSGAVSEEGGRLLFTNGDFKIELEGTKVLAGRNVFLGIRPEDIRPVESGGDLVAAVSVTEPLGPVTYVRAKVGGTSLVFQDAGDVKIPLDSQVRLKLDRNKVSLFDAESQKRIN
jgi:multiple sugar transport system ATP-binding protein